jgi:hypothetical protein
MSTDKHLPTNWLEEKLKHLEKDIKDKKDYSHLDEMVKELLKEVNMKKLKRSTSPIVPMNKDFTLTKDEEKKIKKKMKKKKKKKKKPVDWTSVIKNGEFDKYASNKLKY